MKNMPYEIKQEIRSKAKMQIKAAEKYAKIQEMIEGRGVPIENLLACADSSPGNPPQTEGLAFINNCECENIEGTINEI